MRHIDLAILHIETALEALNEGQERLIVAGFLREALRFLEEPDREAGEKGCTICFPPKVEGG